MKFTCDYCSKEFERYPSSLKGKNKFCSRACCAKFGRKRIILACRVCGKHFERQPNQVKRMKHQYCSRNCANIGKVIKIEYTCDNCGKKIERSPNKREGSNHVFCSVECHYECRRNNPEEFYDNPQSPLSVACDYCGKVFEKKPYRFAYERKFCSTECQHEFLKSQREVACEVCGKPIMRTPSNLERFNHHYCSRACAIEGNKGENHYNWKDGKSFEQYGIEFTSELKKQIRKRDSYRCQECGIQEGELDYRLHIHHIDYDKKNNDPDNLMALCRGCHVKTNFTRKHWTAYFEAKKLGEKVDPRQMLIPLVVVNK